MKNYCSQKSMCRRQYLFEHFPRHLQRPTVKHMCCDLCQLQCECNLKCLYRSPLEAFTQEVHDQMDDLNNDVVSPLLVWDDKIGIFSHNNETS